MAGQNGKINEMKIILEAQVKMMLGTPAAKGGKS